MLSTTMLGTTAFVPKLNITESDSGYLVSVDLPGLKKENISVTVGRDNVLIITGERKEETERDEGEGESKVHVQEKSYGKFTRRIELPSGTDASKIQVQFKDGVLNIDVPKPSKPPAPDTQTLEIRD